MQDVRTYTYSLAAKNNKGMLKRDCASFFYFFLFCIKAYVLLKRFMDYLALIFTLIQNKK